MSDDIKQMTWEEIEAALQRMHARDRERVRSGEISAQDLHFIPADVARNSIVHWSAATTTRFRGSR